MMVKYEPLVTDFKVGDLVWSLVPPTKKSDPIFPSTVWVVIGIKEECTYEIVNATNGNKVVRNGSFLRSVSFSPPPIAESIQPSRIEDQEDHTTSIDDSQAQESQPSPTTLRRSTRLKKPPAYFKEYHTK